MEINSPSVRTFGPLAASIIPDLTALPDITEAHN